jgi:hypothetical protein
MLVLMSCVDITATRAYAYPMLSAQCKVVTIIISYYHHIICCFVLYRVNLRCIADYRNLAAVVILLLLLWCMYVVVSWIRSFGSSD